MPDAHPLDRWIWSALTGRQAALALADGGARRLFPDRGLFVATADRSDASLAALGRLVRAGGECAAIEPDALPPVPGVAVVSVSAIWQMVAGEVGPPSAGLDMVPLTEADAREMLALATLTRPGPFFARTHTLGDFLGVKRAGRLVAMAGERLKPDGFSEVSGVCTHPDHRGRGYGAELTRAKCAHIRARGDTPFLHVYSANAGAIALYEALGFVRRREMTMTSLTAA